MIDTEQDPVGLLGTKAFLCPLFLFFFLINYFIYFWLRWVFVAVHGLSLVAASGGYSSLWYVGFSLRWLLLLQSMGSIGMWASVVVAHGL